VQEERCNSAQLQQHEAQTTRSTAYNSFKLDMYRVAICLQLLLAAVTNRNRKFEKLAG